MPASGQSSSKKAPPTGDPFADGSARPFTLTPATPANELVPVVFASPHSGTLYPESFKAASRLDAVALRRSEDAFVDELYASAPANGAALIAANFPRAYVDPNREAWELDPAMFTDALPAFANTRSPRVRAGLGTIAKVVTNGADIYQDKIPFAEAERRIETCYQPYHDALKGLLDETTAAFGGYLLIDCHSMPSVGGPMDRDPGSDRVDMVLGDASGDACGRWATTLVRETLENMGYHVVLNTPYAGGFTTRHYGRPKEGAHALQIEVNRQLYMDEETITHTPAFDQLQDNLGKLIKVLTAINPEQLKRI